MLNEWISTEVTTDNDDCKGVGKNIIQIYALISVNNNPNFNYFKSWNFWMFLGL